MKIYMDILPCERERRRRKQIRKSKRLQKLIETQNRPALLVLIFSFISLKKWTIFCLLRATGLVVVLLYQCFAGHVILLPMFHPFVVSYLLYRCDRKTTVTKIHEVPGTSYRYQVPVPGTTTGGQGAKTPRHVPLPVPVPVPGTTVL